MLTEAKLGKDVTEINWAGVKIDSDRYAISCIWFESNIIIYVTVNFGIRPGPNR